MKVDNNYEIDVEYGFFDEFDFTDPLTEEQYSMLIERKLNIAKFYQTLDQNRFNVL